MEKSKYRAKKNPAKDRIYIFTNWVGPNYRVATLLAKEDFKLAALFL